MTVPPTAIVMKLDTDIRNTWKGYLLAVGLVVAMTALKFFLEDLFDDGLRLMLLPASVMLSVWFGGLGAGLLAVALTTLSRVFFFIEPMWRLRIDAENAPEVLFHVAEGTIFCLLVYAVLRSRDKLQRSEQRATNILESIRDVFLSVDESWRISYVNGHAKDVTQQPVEELVGKTLWELYPEMQGTPIEAAYRRAMEDRVPVQFESRGMHTGTWYEISVYPSEEGISAYGRDISARKRYEEELQRARQEAEELAAAKTALLANMSHEVRTPLTSLLLMAEMLSRRVSGEHREHILRMKKGAEKLSDLLNAVLTLSRLEAGRVEINKEVSDVFKETDFAVASLLALAEQKDLSLTIEGQSPCYALVDDSFLNSVLNNLIGNAIKYTEVGGVTVIVEGGVDERVGGRAAIIRVEDTGPGIAPDFLPHVFEEFRQQTSGTSPRREGVGLGLAISKRLVELMDGVIEIDSREGSGTTLTITLPGADVPGHLASGTEEEIPVHTGRLPCVLVMDDDELILDLIPELLEGICVVETAATPQQALNSAATGRFDAVLLDISMGASLDGEDVLHRLRQHPNYRMTPIIAVTAYALPGDEARFLRLGFDGYVSKPFEGTALVKALRHALVASAR